MPTRLVAAVSDVVMSCFPFSFRKKVDSHTRSISEVDEGSQVGSFHMIILGHKFEFIMCDKRDLFERLCLTKASDWVLKPDRNFRYSQCQTLQLQGVESGDG